MIGKFSVAAIAAAISILVPRDAAADGWPVLPPAAATGASAAGKAHNLDAADLQAWLDGTMPGTLARDNVAGAVVVVVKNDAVLFEKGYGFSDVAARRRVDPENTLFRMASVSKLFTWTAVMQQVEQGRLDLDADINTYLDFRIPDTWPKPITLRNLMTHTSGFEDASKNTYAPDAASLPALGDLLRSWMPERMYPPGAVVAYSNYGAALAGYIVQRVSHERFEDYVARHILEPLAMAHASFSQPLPPQLAANLSKGYVLATDAPAPFEFVELRPAGGLSATGADMARFMIAHLNGGGRFLKPATTALMHSEVYRPDPALPGMGLGFWHLDRNGHEIVAHTGDTVLFHSGLYLILDAHTGLFVASNSAGGDGDLPHDIFGAFADRYFPGTPPRSAVTLKSAFADGQLVAGTYENSRRADSNFMVSEEVFNERTIALAPDATITLSGSRDATGELRHWREIAPFRWQELHGDRLLDAKVENGRVVAVMTDASPPISQLMPATFWRNGAWNVPLFLGTIGLLVLIVVLWPIGAFLRWCLGKPSPRGKVAAVLRLARVAALVNLVFLCGWAEFLSYSDSHVEIMDARIDWLLRILQATGVFGAIGALVAVYAAVLAMSTPRTSWWSRISGILVAAACLSTVWFAVSLKFISWALNY